MTRERDIEGDTRDRIKAAGGWMLKWVSPGQRGVPDNIVLWPDTTHFVEFKKPGEAPTVEQERVHRKLLLYGHRVVVISTREEAEAYLRKYGA